jgi:hypothetical protein
MTNKLDLDEFIECWKLFVKQNEPAFLEKFDSRTDRTQLIIGNDSSSVNTGSPFGDFFREFFGEKYFYRKEDGSVDLSIYENDFLRGIMDMNTEDKVSVISKETLNYFPKYYNVLIEQENTIEKAYEEMYKLTYFRANLKVLITYIWNPSKSGDLWTYAHDRLSKNFESIIKQTNESYPENGETDYVLITGQKIDNKIIWKYTGLSVMSTLKQVDNYVIVHDVYKPTINE